MRKTFLALATAFSVALGSFVVTAAPAQAALTAPRVETAVPSDAQFVKHRKRQVCHVHWKKQRLWKWHRWVWVKVPVRHCHWVRVPHHHRW
jgi:hypothetical protein